MQIGDDFAASRAATTPPTWTPTVKRGNAAFACTYDLRDEHNEYQLLSDEHSSHRPQRATKFREVYARHDVQISRDVGLVHRPRTHRCNGKTATNQISRHKAIIDHDLALNGTIYAVDRSGLVEFEGGVNTTSFVFGGSVKALLGTGCCDSTGSVLIVISYACLPGMCFLLTVCSMGFSLLQQRSQHKYDEYSFLKISFGVEICV